MKRIFISLICILNIVICFGQAPTNYPTPFQNQGSANIGVNYPGGVFVRGTLVPPIFSDTSAANLTKAKLYAGSVIKTTSPDAFWYRNNAATEWLLAGGNVFSPIDSATYANNLLCFWYTDTSGSAIATCVTIPAGTYFDSAYLSTDSSATDYSSNGTYKMSVPNFSKYLIGDQYIRYDTVGRYILTRFLGFLPTDSARYLIREDILLLNDTTLTVGPETVFHDDGEDTSITTAAVFEITRAPIGQSYFANVFIDSLNVIRYEAGLPDTAVAVPPTLPPHAILITIVQVIEDSIVQPVPFVPPTNFWGITGNTGTNPINNFIGTLDPKAFIIRTSNIPRDSIDATGDFHLLKKTPTNNAVSNKMWWHATGGTGNEQTATIALSGQGGVNSADWQFTTAGGLSWNSSSGQYYMYGTNPTMKAINGLDLYGTKATRGIAVGSRSYMTSDYPFRVYTTSIDQANLKNYFFINHLGQVGIKDSLVTVSASAILDVQSTVRGVLDPRMTGVQMNAIATPATGLRVYNTDSLAFCYYNGSAWVKIGGSGGSGGTGWGLTGNTGTSELTNFLGTTDNVPLYLRVNNDTIAKFGINSNVSLGSTNYAIGFGSFAFGDNSQAVGSASMAFGNGSIATGNKSFAAGDVTESIGDNSFAFGDGQKTYGLGSVSFGNNNAAYNQYSVTFGVNLISKATNGFVVGGYNDTLDTPTEIPDVTDRIFQIGNGNKELPEIRSNAMTVLRNGNVGIGVVDPTDQLQVLGRINVDGIDGNNSIVTTGNTTLGDYTNGTGIVIAGSSTDQLIQYNAVNGHLFTGNVGLGVLSPTASLHINAADTFALKITSQLSTTVLNTDSVVTIGTNGNIKKAAGIKTNFTSLANNDLLKYNSSNSRFENIALTGVSPITFNPATFQIGISASPTFTTPSVTSLNVTSGTTNTNSIGWTDMFIFRSAAATARIEGAATTRYVEWNVGSTAVTMVAKGSGADALSMRAGTSGNGNVLLLGGANQTATFTRNLNDANFVLGAVQSGGSATGDLFQGSNSGGIVFRVSQAGNVAVASSAAPTSTLTVNGSFSTAYVAKTANYTATISDNVIECTANSFTVTLPTAVGVTGRHYVVTNSGSGTISMATTSSQTFVNVTGTPTSLSIAQFTNYEFISNGANWLAYKIVN